MVFSAKRRSTGGKEGLGKAPVGRAQDIFDACSQMSKSSGRLHQTAASTMANQRNLQKLGEMVGRRLQDDINSAVKGKSTESRNILEKAQSASGMMGKQRFSRIRSTADGVSQRFKIQDAILSEQVKHAQKEALRRFIGQVIE